VILRGKVGDEETTFEFPVKLAAPAGDDANAFVAKLWASRRVGEILDEIDLHGKHDELVKELVDLAARHGILTPYTSFLADDSDQPRDRAGAAVEAASRLSALDDAEGSFGFRQREAKAALRSTAAPATARGGVRGGFVPAHAPPNAAASGPAVTYYDAETDQHRVAKNLIVVGRKTFFRRGGRWVDSTVTADEEREATAVERFSPEYFDLVARHGEYVAAYLAIDDPVTLKLDGRVYAW
ncbi:MAG TPA: hypothetical protein PJ982_13300, partial [Lacipirellulaceae bacterium]|nr:hypothetical protein [Lacipirellulaceae bacterium]